MDKKNISTFSRCLLALVAISLIIALFYPLWSIELMAPQYPEGLTLLIYPNKIGGDVSVINGLNHYIGMKTLHSEDFLEFQVLPYIIGFFALASFFVIWRKRRSNFFVLFGSYILFTIVSVIDFYIWTYNYGHDLNPDSAIKVPGMSYQPPLIGYKKLLNMEIFSWPDISGYILIFVALVLFLIFLREILIIKKMNKGKLAAIFIGLAFICTSCSTSKSPEAIKINVDQCEYCRMTISDTKYGAELITRKGRVYKFDDISCLINYRKANNVEVAAYYVLDYSKENELINAEEAYYLAGGEIQTPMAGGMIGIRQQELTEDLKDELMAERISWSDIKNQWEK